MAVIAAHELPTDPLDALHELARGEIELERLCRNRMSSARAAGATWEQIGAALGITRQAAREFSTRDAREAIAGNADGDEQLGEDDALDLAVEEVRGVRRGRPLVEGQPATRAMRIAIRSAAALTGSSARCA